ncbi:MAG: methylcrotonoyl-CoA carboxylase, partial [Gammaproteobacteria bacterium]|nr:methylcrotonoyl-CoA carboxylase [Gammaproteobacteria bacterium]NIX10164.1 methylcrotonoyl-CoA carboxylase [Gammaproteobacteria bacterium]
MAILESSVDTEGALFRERREHMQALVDDLTEKLATISEGGGEKARERHRAKGKLPVRERINRLLDPGSPFLELAPM